MKKRKTELFLDRNGWIRERLIRKSKRKITKAQKRREKIEEAEVLSKDIRPVVVVEGTNVIVDGISRRIPVALLSCTDEQIVRFYGGWYREKEVRNEKRKRLAVASQDDGYSIQAHRQGIGNV